MIGFRKNRKVSLDTSGFAHHVLVVLVLLAVAIGGTAYLVKSHADTIDTTTDAYWNHFGMYLKNGTPDNNPSCPGEGGVYAKINSPYMGAYQFNQSTWSSYDGFRKYHYTWTEAGQPSAPHSIQDLSAREAFNSRGPEPWPVNGPCAANYIAAHPNVLKIPVSANITGDTACQDATNDGHAPAGGCPGGSSSGSSSGGSGGTSTGSSGSSGGSGSGSGVTGGSQPNPTPTPAAPAAHKYVATILTSSCSGGFSVRVGDVGTGYAGNNVSAEMDFGPLQNSGDVKTEGPKTPNYNSGAVSFAMPQWIQNGTGGNKVTATLKVTDPSNKSTNGNVVASDSTSFICAAPGTPTVGTGGDTTHDPITNRTNISPAKLTLTLGKATTCNNKTIYISAWDPDADFFNPESGPSVKIDVNSSSPRGGSYANLPAKASQSEAAWNSSGHSHGYVYSTAGGPAAAGTYTFKAYDLDSNGDETGSYTTASVTIPKC